MKVSVLKGFFSEEEFKIELASVFTNPHTGKRVSQFLVRFMDQVYMPFAGVEATKDAESDKLGVDSLDVSFGQADDGKLEIGVFSSREDAYSKKE